MRELLDTTLSRESIMADQPKDQNATKQAAEKKQPETVLLTSEELRAIAGGSAATNPTSTPKTMASLKPGG
jgi:hypothetical protein